MCDSSSPGGLISLISRPSRAQPVDLPRSRGQLPLRRGRHDRRRSGSSRSACSSTSSSSLVSGAVVSFGSRARLSSSPLTSQRGKPTRKFQTGGPVGSSPPSPAGWSKNFGSVDKYAAYTVLTIRAPLRRNGSQHRGYRRRPGRLRRGWSAWPAGTATSTRIDVQTGADGGGRSRAGAASPATADQRRRPAGRPAEGQRGTRRPAYRYAAGLQPGRRNGSALRKRVFGVKIESAPALADGCGLLQQLGTASSTRRTSESAAQNVCGSWRPATCAGMRPPRASQTARCTSAALTAISCALVSQSGADEVGTFLASWRYRRLRGRLRGGDRLR